MPVTYQRYTFQKKLKTLFPDHALAPNVDILIYLDYIHFMQRLAEESEKAAAGGHTRSLRAAHIDQVMERVLQEFRG